MIKISPYRLGDSEWGYGPRHTWSLDSAMNVPVRDADVAVAGRSTNLIRLGIDKTS